MKNKIHVFLYGMVCAAIIFSGCATSRRNDFSRHDFSLKDTLSIFLLNNGKDYYFCIPVQYVGDYQMGRFEFAKGNIRIGGYDILLKRNELDISVYLNEAADANGNTAGDFSPIYLEKSGRVMLSKMAEPLGAKTEADYMMNQYEIFIEKYLTELEMKNILDEYKKGNVHSSFSIWYDITLDNEEQNGSGLLDDFELHDGPAADYIRLFPHFDFFRAKYLQK